MQVLSSLCHAWEVSDYVLSVRYRASSSTTWVFAGIQEPEGAEVAEGPGGLPHPHPGSPD